MTPAAPVAALLASSLETFGVLGYLGATALVVRLAVRWARDAVSPAPAPFVDPSRPAGPAAR